MWSGHSRFDMRPQFEESKITPLVRDRRAQATWIFASLCVKLAEGEEETWEKECLEFLDTELDPEDQGLDWMKAVFNGFFKELALRPNEHLYHGCEFLLAFLTVRDIATEEYERELKALTDEELNPIHSMSCHGSSDGSSAIQDLVGIKRKHMETIFSSILMKAAMADRGVGAEEADLFTFEKGRKVWLWEARRALLLECMVSTGGDLLWMRELLDKSRIAIQTDAPRREVLKTEVERLEAKVGAKEKSQHQIESVV
jgi:hypothetical protein